MNLIPDDIDWSEYERETEAASKVRPAGEFLAQMIANIGKPREQDIGGKMPWDKTHGIFTFRPGEVTLWAGVNGHGKSAVTGMVAASMLGQPGQKVCIASFEMKPDKTLDRMVRQFMGLNSNPLDPAEHDLYREIYEQFAGLCDKRLWLYDQQGTVTPDRIVAVVRYCCKVLGITQVFVDSLMKCVKGEDDYNGQKALIDEFCAIARDYGRHIHLVHHLRKTGKETDLPDKNDVKGSGSIADQVDNILLVWRNKQKEMDLASGKTVNPEDADTVIFSKKQRNGTGWEGPIKLYFDAQSMQYTGAPSRFMDMCPWPHHEKHKDYA